MAALRRISFLVAARSSRRQLHVEELEARLLMTADALTDDMPTTDLAPFPPGVLAAGQGTSDSLAADVEPAISYTTLANGMPVLNSYPSAPADIFLDFDGGTFHGSTTVTPYDTDGNSSTFSPAEQAVIVEAWRQMSVYFAMFNVNVTTVQHSGVPRAWDVIGNNVSGGLTYTNTFPDSRPESENESYDAQNRVSGIAHEIGHNFGNQHTSNYNDDGTKEDEYHAAFDPLHGPLMGIDYDGLIHKWTLWHSTTSVLNTEDDMANILHDLSAYGGDGYRPDDYGGTIATATPLDVSGAQQSKVGIIERLTDTDMFSFTSTGGTYDIEVGRDAPSGVDVKISVYDAAGNLLAAQDGDPRAVPLTMVNDSQLDINLPAGTFYLAVQSHGNYDDQGQYLVRVDPNPTGWRAQDIDLNNLAGYSGYDPSSGTFTVAGSGFQIDQKHDGLQYDFQTLTGDGSITVKLTNMTGTRDFAEAGVMIRDSLDPGAEEAGILETYSYGPLLSWRPTTGGASNGYITGVSQTFAPMWLRLVRAGNTFTVYTSPDGQAWAQFDTPQVVNMGPTVYIGLASNSNDYSTSNAPFSLNTATFTNVQVTGNLNVGPTLNSLPAPTGLAVSSVTSNSVVLTLPASGPAIGDTNGDGVVNTTDFNNLANNFGNSGIGDVNGDGIVDLSDFTLIRANLGRTANTGLAIERSSDGVNFTQIATITNSATTYTDTNLSDAQRYFYRIRTLDNSGASIPSTAVMAATRAGAISNLNAITYSSSRIVLDWTDAAGESGFRIERSSDNGAHWTTLSTVGQNFDLYVDTSPVAGATYLYHVVTIDSMGVSATSTPLAVNVPASEAPSLQVDVAPTSQVQAVSGDGMSATSSVVVVNSGVLSETPTTNLGVVTPITASLSAATAIDKTEGSPPVENDQSPVVAIALPVVLPVVQTSSTTNSTAENRLAALNYVLAQAWGRSVEPQIDDAVLDLLSVAQDDFSTPLRTRHR